MFSELPRPYSSPLKKNDHPELDNSPELCPNDVAKYQSMIGSLLWTVSLGRFDIATAVMTMSGFCLAPRQGHLDWLMCIYGYLRQFKDAKVHI